MVDLSRVLIFQLLHPLFKRVLTFFQPELFYKILLIHTTGYCIVLFAPPICQAIMKGDHVLGVDFLGRHKFQADQFLDDHIFFSDSFSRP